MRGTRKPRRGRKLGIVTLALTLLGGLMMIVPSFASAKDNITYSFVFEHTDGNTTTVSGVATDKEAFIAEAGGTSATSPSGMVMHLSCSDEFPGGWGEKDGPVQGLDTEWRVKSYSIQKGSKTCGGGDPIPPPSPAVDIEKATNGFDADDPTGPEIQVGDTVTWTYVVTNTGDTDLDNVRVLDYVPAVGVGDPTTIDCPRDELGVGESMTCEATGVAELGQYANEGKVLAEGPATSPIAVDGKKKQYTFIFEHPDGTTTRIDGSAEKNEAFLPNAGGTSKDNPKGMTVHVSCSDDFPGGFGKKDGPDPVADSAWKVQSFFIREVKDGEIKKSCGQPLPATQTVMDQDPSHYIGVPGDPDIDIEKLTNNIDADTPQEGPSLVAGERVRWTYIVTNTGDVPLFDIDVVDDVEGFIGTVDELQPGRRARLTLIGTVEAGSYANEGCAAGTTDDGETVEDCDPSHYNTPDPDIDIEKLTEGVDADRPQDGPELEAGTEVEWTYIVTNTGDVALFDIDVVDDIEGFIGTIAGLRPGQSTTLTKTGIVESGDYANEGCATGTTRGGEEVSDCDPSHYHSPDYPFFPSIDIEKATNGEDADRPTGPRLNVGDRVTWTYEVTNTGHETLYGVYVYDEQEGRVDCPKSRLHAGDSMTCRMHGAARAGQYANEAWVTAWTDDGMVRDADWSHYYGAYDRPQDASIDLEKATNGHDADRPNGPEVKEGNTVTWTYELTNTGDVTLYAIFLYDEEEGRISCPDRHLAAGESMTCSLDGTAMAGQYANEAWVTAWTGDDRMVEDEDWSHYTGIARGY